MRSDYEIQFPSDKPYWFFSVGLNSEEPLSVTGSRILIANRSTLYLNGQPLDPHMRPLRDEDFHTRLVHNQAFLQKCNGGFGGVLVSGDDIIIFVDRVGMHRVYFMLDEGCLYVSNHVDKIVSGCNQVLEVNYRAWGEMWHQQTLLSSHTFFKDIHAISVGEYVKVSRRLKRYSRINYDTVYGKGAIDDRPVESIAKDIVAELTSCLSDAELEFHGTFSATISGGMDSRLLLGIAEKAKLAFPLFTADTDTVYNEYALLKPLLAYWNRESSYYPVPPDYFQLYAEKCFSNTDFHCLQHIWFACAAADCKDLRSTFTMTGIGAGELMRLFNDNRRFASLIPFFIDGDIDGLMQQFELLYPQDQSGFLNPDFYDSLSVAYHESLRDSLSDFLSKPRGAMDWFIKGQLFNCIVYFFTMYADELSGFSPYLSTNVLDILFSLPQDGTILGEKLYNALYAQVDPKLLSYPSTRSSSIEKFAQVPKLHNHDTLIWIKERLLSGRLAENGILNEERLLAYFEKCDMDKSYQVHRNLKTLLLLNAWYGKFQLWFGCQK